MRLHARSVLELIARNGLEEAVRYRHGHGSNYFRARLDALRLERVAVLSG